MTFSVELSIWLVFCTAGLIAAGLSLRLATLILRRQTTPGMSDALSEGLRRLWRTNLEHTIGWAFFLGAGALAATQPPVPAPAQTAVGAVVEWLLIATVGLWSYQTANDYLYTRRVWRRTIETSR